MNGNEQSAKNYYGGKASRVMQHPEKWIGKRVDGIKWAIPDGFVKCAITNKLYRERDAYLSCYVRFFIDRSVLSVNGIYVEEADWLSEEGYHIVLDTIERLGLSHLYNHSTDLLYA